MKSAIRLARDADAPALIALARRTIAADYPPFLGDAAVSAFIDSGAADRYVEGNLAYCTTILVDGTIAGLCVCRDDLIDLLMIDHDRHRQGLGGRLLASCEAELFKSNSTLRLESFEGNDKANGFYRKNGWREIGRYDDASSGLRKIRFTKDRPRSDGS